MAPLPRALASLAALVAISAATALLPSAAAAQTPVTCDRVVAAGGSDDGDGSAAAPFATPQRLARALAPGQTGCVRGTVAGNVWISTPSVTVTSEPGQRGALRGQLVVDKDAANVTVSDLDLDSTGLNKPSPIVLGDDALFARNDVTNRRSPSICFILGQFGHDDDAVAERTRIEFNRIHDCGISDNHRHGIYIEHADGTRIIGNEIFDNADRGIQLYPSAQNTLIAGNVIDGNGQGVIFSGTGGSASSGNVVRNNVITYPRLRAAVESWWDDGTPAPTGNVAHDNCVYGGDNLVDTANGGFAERGNQELDPLFVDRAAKDFRLRAGSPCAAILEAGRAGVTATLAAPRATFTPRAATTPAPEPLKVSVSRTGERVQVTVRLTVQPAARSFARVEVRAGQGRWKSLGIRQVRGKRALKFRTRAPRGKKLVVRTTLLQAGKAKRVSFRRAGAAKRRR